MSLSQANSQTSVILPIFLRHLIPYRSTQYKSMHILSALYTVYEFYHMERIHRNKKNCSVYNVLTCNPFTSNHLFSLFIYLLFFFVCHILSQFNSDYLFAHR